VFILSRGSDDQWTAPSSSGVLNTDIASSIIRTVILLPYQETLPLMDSTVLSDYGFGDGQQQFVIEILLKTGEGHIVVIGDLTSTRSAYYALVDNADKIYLLERGAVDFLITQWRTPPLT
ncbi:MAG: DUF4340 domain-containing protein, partial [Anaerolineae bacterium]|nr:DUF4340 domain-containing protein [Anaerolineae bacterium]